MNASIQVKYLWTRRLGARLVLLSLFFGGVAGCAPAGTPPVALATPAPLSMPSPAASAEATLPSGWDTLCQPGTMRICHQPPGGHAMYQPGDVQWDPEYLQPQSPTDRSRTSSTSL